MGRFIQIALAAADFAVKMANWSKKRKIDLDEVGVYVSSGIGGFDIIEREHRKLVQGGPGKISPFFIPSAIVNLASGHISIRYGARGTELRHRHCLLRFRARYWRFFQNYRTWRCRNDDLRRHRSHDHSDGRWRFRSHEGSVHAQR